MDLLDAPALAWTGAGYVVAVSLGGQLHLEHVDATGTAVAPPVPIGAPGTLIGPTSAAFTGQHVVLTWRHATDGGIVSLVSPDGVRAKPDRMLGPVDDGPFVAWSGSLLAMVYHRNGFPIEFTRSTADGGSGGSIGLVGISHEVRSVVWHGGGFAVGMRERTNPRRALFYDWSADAKTLGSLREVGGMRVGFVDAASTGAAGGLGTALIDNQGVVLLPHDATGALTAGETVIEAQSGELDVSVAIGWSGSTFLTAAVEDVAGSDRIDLIPCRVTGPAGAIETLPTVAIPGLQIARPTAISAASGRIAATWVQRDGAGNTELFLVQRCL
jgi:hypothetical protein